MFFLVRKFIKLGIVLAILIGLVVGADIGSRIFTQDQIASAVKKSSGASSVSVSISDFPWVYDLAAHGRVNKIHVVAHDVPVGPLVLGQVDLTVNGVVIDRNALLQGKEKFDQVSRATASVVYQLTPAEAALAAAADITAVPAPAGGAIQFEAHGRVLFSLDLAAIPLIPSCGFQAQQAGAVYTFTCTVSPVPQSVLNSLSR